MTSLVPDGKFCAVLTGASGGIGRSIAKELAPRCHWLILVGRNLSELQAVGDGIGAEPSGCAVHIVHGDLLQTQTLDRLEALVRDLGGINLLINNAGISDFHAFSTQESEQIRRMLETNLLAPMLLSRRLIPLMDAAPSAQIVNIGSVFGQIGFPGFAAYCASKAGLRGFSQALRRELRDTSITIRHFAPRATVTAINSNAVAALNRDLNTAEDTPEHVAAELMRFLRSGRWERVLGRKESFFVLLNKLLPALPDKAILAQLPIIRKHLPK